MLAGNSNEKNLSPVNLNHEWQDFSLSTLFLRNWSPDNGHPLASWRRVLEHMCMGLCQPIL